MRNIVKSGAGSAVVHAAALGGLLLVDPAADEPIMIDLTIMPSESMAPGPAAENPAVGPPSSSPPARAAARVRAVSRAPRPTSLLPATLADPVLDPALALPSPAPEIQPPIPAAAAPDSTAVGHGEETSRAGPTSATTGPAGKGSFAGPAGPVAGSGLGPGGAGAQQAYLAKHFAYIREAIQRSASYPPLARRMGWVGRVVLSFRILPDGAVANVQVAKGSGVPVLDRGAVEAVRRASPFPRPPAEAEIVVPVAYALE